jgi:aminoglycoside phosphotransferase (APT) family kinase protein
MVTLPSIAVGELQRSSRDLDRMRERLELWLATKLPPDAAPVLRSLEGTSANGMSSETLLFDAEWTHDGARCLRRLVARVAPDSADVPVFPSYDLHRQYRAIGLIDQLTTVPVPPVWWSEPDPHALGAPFFVMGRIDGQVPPDVMPYNFGDCWLFDADPADQRRLQDATVAVLAELHAIDRPEERFDFLTHDTPGDTPLRRRVGHTRAWYDFAAAGLGRRSPLIERGFGWLDAHWPAEEGPTVACWGDSRIGNVMYRDFAPVAVLDWEMAALAPCELDVAWLIYGHRIFEDIANSMDLPARRRGRNVRVAHGSYAARPRVLRHLRRPPVRDRVPAHRAPAGPLRRGRRARRHRRPGDEPRAARTHAHGLLLELVGRADAPRAPGRVPDPPGPGVAALRGVERPELL